MLKTNIQFVALVRADDKLWKVEGQIGSDVAEDPPVGTDAPEDFRFSTRNMQFIFSKSHYAIKQGHGLFVYIS